MNNSTLAMLPRAKQLTFQTRLPEGLHHVGAEVVDWKGDVINHHIHRVATLHGRWRVKAIARWTSPAVITVEPLTPEARLEIAS